MGREATVTYEQVATAADTMKAAGSKPTARTIRERLGNIGSMGTITRLLQTWKANQEPPTAGVIALPPTMQRTILEFMNQELARSRAALEAELAEQQRETADLAADNERQTMEIVDRNETITGLQTERSTLRGRLVQMDTALAAVKDEASRARETAETARVELAKAALRLEAMARLEADLAALRAELDTERKSRVSAEQQAAVLAAKLEAATARTTKAESEAAAATAQTHDLREALLQETSKTSTAHNTIANLNGKLDAMQSQLQHQASDLDTARREVQKATEEAAELRGKHGHASVKPKKTE